MRIDEILRRLERRKIALDSFARQIELENFLGWFLGPRGTTSCREMLVANLFPDGHNYGLIVPNYKQIIKLNDDATRARDPAFSA